MIAALSNHDTVEIDLDKVLADCARLRGRAGARPTVSAVVARARAAARGEPAINDALAELGGAAQAIDSWIDAATPVFRKLADAVAAQRNLLADLNTVSVSAMTEALNELENAATQIDVWLDMAGPLRQRFTNAVTELRKLVGASNAAVPRAGLAVKRRLARPRQSSHRR